MNQTRSVIKLLYFLQDEVFKDKPLKWGDLIPFSTGRRDMWVFQTPCKKHYALKAREELEKKGFRVAIFKDKEEEDLYIFTFSKRKKDLNSLIGHFNYYHYKEDKNNDWKQH